MKFEIITNSQSKTGYDIPDSIYRGRVPGFAMGFQVEAEKDGEIGYTSVDFVWKTPDEIAEDEDALMLFTLMNPEWKPTGRVVFRGYYEEEWDDGEFGYIAVPDEIVLRSIEEKWYC